MANAEVVPGETEWLQSRSNQLAEIPFGQRTSRRWQRQARRLQDLPLLRLEVDGEGQSADLDLDHRTLLWPGMPRDPAGEDQVPEVALEGGEVECPQFSLQPSEGAAVIPWMIDEVGH